MAAARKRKRKQDQHEKPKYRPRGQFVGTWRMLCPFCGLIAIYQLGRAGKWQFRCKDCRRFIGLAATIVISDPHHHNGPYKAVQPDDMIFPTLPMRKRKGNEPVHAVEAAGDI